MVLGATALDESNIWMGSSAFYFAWVLLNSVIAISDREFHDVLRSRSATRLFALVTMIFVVLSLSLNLINTVLVHQSWPYLAALACGIVIAFIQFSSLLHTLWNANSETA